MDQKGPVMDPKIKWKYLQGPKRTFKNHPKKTKTARKGPNIILGISGNTIHHGS
jgi:hypothetical protein